MKKIVGGAMAVAMLAITGCDVADPDCTPEKAAKRQVQQATIGVSNRCTPAETARDTAGIDG
ncbi:MULTISPECIES: hypothetical protein [unclassified Ruegeria]|uniref:hypothetical protein n=1 Tax=unclassified Ruegeria TaxID=2625375 RepID=UPI001AD982EE|nr:MULTISPECIES: hypothetical protein [unclassified Ruegeria]MBO9410974.1 hypothetical protein [Ruegeria sp. R8_1]MBO9415175.1 hypothetical protein [Ruegeria sp. R8_2]